MSYSRNDNLSEKQAHPKELLQMLTDKALKTNIFSIFPL